MLKTTRALATRKLYPNLDYAKHMPKEYVERVKREIPKKVFDDRFGAPAITRWVLPPGEYTPSHKRPWEETQLKETLDKSKKYHMKKLVNKWYPKRVNRVEPLSDEKWTIFVGDRVQVMVGKDKGKQGSVSLISRETNEVLVDGLHTKLETEFENAERLGLPKTMVWKEQPLDVSKGQVMLVDPNDHEPCEALWKWDAKGEPFRVSTRSGFEIPLPSQAKVTYEYQQPEKYIEVEGKDTPAAVALERTYVPKLMSFEDEILTEMGVEEKRQRAPKYWWVESPIGFHWPGNPPRVDWPEKQMLERKGKK